MSELNDMALQNNIAELDDTSQLELAIVMIENGLSIWTDYTSTNKLEYTDHVVGMHHKIDSNLLQRAIEVSKEEVHKKNLLDKIIKKNNLKNILDEFLEPKTAIQDFNFELPNEVELIFHSTYNLLEAINGAKPNYSRETMVYVSINQSIDAIESSNLMTIDEVKDILRKFYISKGIR